MWTRAAQMGLKMGCIHSFGHHNSTGIMFGKPWLWGCTVRCARAVRKVGHSPPPVGSFLGVGLPQGTVAIVCPCSINPPPSCVYVPLQMGTLRPVYGDTFSGYLLRGIIFCSHFSDPLLHSPWTLMLEIGCSTLAPMGCEFLP